MVGLVPEGDFSVKEPLDLIKLLFLFAPAFPFLLLAGVAAFLTDRFLLTGTIVIAVLLILSCGFYLMAQAEHDPLAAAILITTDEALAAAVPAAIAAQLEHHPRAAITRQALEDWGLIVVCDDLTTAAGLSDRFAPEHLELLVEDPEPLAERIRHAGAIFLGPWSPEAVGDYLAGPNHTLPTSGTARFAGALSVETFLRHTSLIHFNQAALEATGPAVVELAESEGLHSHAESVRRRLG